MESILRSHQVPHFEFVTAVGPEDPGVVETAKLQPQFHLPYIACTESHAKVWEKIAALPDEEIGLVLEDDVFFHKDWRSLLDQALAELPSDWELFMLDCFYLQGWDFTSDGNCGRTGIHPATDCTFGDAYLLRPNSARWLLHRRENVLTEGGWSNNETLIIDLQDRNRSFTYIPKLVLQNFDESDIQTAERTRSTAMFYERTYFMRFPKKLYQIPERGD